MKLCSVCHHVFSDEDEQCPDHGPMLKPDPLVGKTLSSFKITGWLGEGGMGILYRAEHETIRRKAAVKVIKREFITDQTMAGRFEQEARAVAKIGHPHLIDIFDIGVTPDERVYYIMELLEGRSLSAKMAERRLSLQEFVPLFNEACDALEATHKVGIIHRDLKPDNIFLIERPGEPPFVKVLDFGVAKVLGTDEDVQNKLTRTGSIVGTPQYMAPEQIDGSKIDGRADIYAMGVILYELATGMLPFKAETLGGMLKAHLLDNPATFDTSEKLSEGVDQRIEAVTFKAIAKKPDERYQTISELRDDLERVRLGQDPACMAWWIERAPQMKTMTGEVGSTLAGQLANATMAMNGATTAVAIPPPRSSASRYLTIGLVVVALVPAAILISGKFATKPLPPPPAALPVVSTAPVKKRGPDLRALKSKALGVVTTALKDGDPVVRKQAVETLSEGHDPRHHTLATPLLSDDDSQVEASAASTLGTLGARPAIPALKEALGKDPNVDTYIAEALIKIGDEPEKKVATDLLKKAAKKGGDATRLKATMVLFDAGQHEAQKLFEQRSKLAKPGDPVGVNVLGKLAQKGDMKARDKLIAFLEEGDEGAQLLAAEALARMGDESGHERLSKIASTEKSPLRLVAYRILASIDDYAGFDLFSTTFSDSSRALPDRILAAQGLGASGERSVLETMGPAMDDGEPGVRLAAAGAVLAIAAADPKALAARSLDWATSALGDSSWAVRANAISILADTDSAEAVPLLGKLIHDERVEIRRAAVAQLGKTKSAEAVKLLEEALADEKIDVRLAALRSMGQIGGSAVGPIIARHLLNASETEKVVAAAQLAKLGDKSHLDEIKNALLSKDADVRRIALEESASAAPELAGDAVQAALKDKSFPVRFAAAVQLADKDSKDGEAVLQEAVKKGGTDGLTAYAALSRLGVEPKHQIDPESLLKAKDPEVKLKAVEVAGKLPPAKALAFYKRALKVQDARVRMAALSALGGLAGDKANKESLALVKAALNDEDSAVRAKAAAIFSKFAPTIPDEPPPTKATPTSAQGSTPAAHPVDAGAAPVDLSHAPVAEPAAPPPPDLATPAPVVKAVPAAPDMAQAIAHAASPDMASPAVVAVTDDMRETANLALTSAELALRTGHYQDAIRELQRAHKINPTLPVYFSLGEAYSKQADRETDPARAKDNMEKAIANYRRSKRGVPYADELEARMKEIQ